MKMEKEKMVISSNTEAGTIYDEIPIELTGEELSISFNPRYLHDALSVIDDHNVILQLNTRVSPCIIKSADNGSDYKYLILPLRSLS